MRYLICLISLFIAIPANTLATASPEYVGIELCRMCHIPHFESWSETKMSQAFDLLKPGVRSDAKTKAGLDPETDYTNNSACLMCHTTGFGRPGGFISMDKTPDMANVQCEMCHGPGSLYAQMMLQVKGTYTRQDYINKGKMIMPSKQNNVCTQQCHNQASPFVKPDYNFDFENRKAIGTHKHNLQYIYMPF
ncbi:MAG: cytochrome c family protein [Gammaproteobacteria bacterium]|nr:cytochrome c family protein [Gammaproteobacteria bacterium]